MKEYASSCPCWVLLLFWLLLIRPAQRRNRALAELQASLHPGDRIMLSSGIYGTLRAIEDDRAQVEVSAGTVLTVARGAVARVVEPGARTTSTEED
ncbi:MAG: preprotein translocase subunit YajC [Nocardioides sp.]